MSRAYGEGTNRLAKSLEYRPRQDCDMEPAPSSARSCPSSSEATSPGSDLCGVTRARRIPRPGKGHKKSRTGCYNCKRRRVKCSEEAPRCRHCKRMGLTCEYPSLPIVLPSPSSSTSTALRTTPGMLSLEDLRFFHHFLLKAYPPLPFGADGVWQDVAAMAYEYDFLAHAMLGLAAQHLTLSGAGNFSVQALGHRVLAINALNEALSRPCLERADGDARYAAIMSLTYQSSYMTDGMMDFFAMQRGWMIIQSTVEASFDDSMFLRFTRDAYIDSMRRLIPPKLETPDLSEELEDFSASLRTLAPLCQSVAELSYLSNLERTSQLARTSVETACLELVSCYSLTNKMDPDHFAAFTDQQNFTAQVLLSHFFLLDCLLQDSVLGPEGKSYGLSKQVALSWVQGTAEKLPSSYKTYMVWPLGMVRLWKP